MGYGFVKFFREEDALSAIQSKNGTVIGDKKIKVSLARPSSEDIKGAKIYVKNLPNRITDAELVELFRPVKHEMLPYNMNILMMMHSLELLSNVELCMLNRRSLSFNSVIVKKPSDVCFHYSNTSKV